MAKSIEGKRVRVTINGDDAGFQFAPNGGGKRTVYRAVKNVRNGEVRFPFSYEGFENGIPVTKWDARTEPAMIGEVSFRGTTVIVFTTINSFPCWRTVPYIHPAIEEELKKNS